MLRRLYDWTISMADHPAALWVLFAVAFVESSIFPIPPDVLLIPMIIARPKSAFWIATVCMVGSVLGGIAGYAIGAFAFDSIGRPVLEALGKADYFDQFATNYNEWGIWVVLTAGVTPFPYKVITILSGATQLPLGVFIVTSIIARSIRFFAIGALLYYFGQPIRDFIERRLGLVFTAFVILLVGSFAALRYL
ncbi:MAG: YqaA family protein [Pseudomonadota bacterium]